MTWRERYLPASYRGVAFFVERHEAEYGRRVAVHSLPQRDRPYVEDLGRAVRTYRVEAYTLGDDYDRDRDRLIEACERPGAGFPFRVGSTLVHPYLGALDVVCRLAIPRESDRELRMARISLEFIESGDDPRPAEGAAVRAQAEDAADALDEAAEERLTETLEVADVPESVLEAAATEARELGRAIQRLDVFSGPATEVESLRSAVTSLLATTAQVVTSPADLAVTVVDAVSRVRDAASNLGGALEAYRALALLRPTLRSGLSAPVVLANANADRVVRLARQAAASGAVRAAARNAWESYGDAVQAREAIAATIDELADEEGELSDPVYRALVLLRSRLVRAVPPPDEQLPRVRRLALAASLPAVALAYRLYDDVGRDEEIARRNHVAHPLFVPAGEVEVLSD